MEAAINYYARHIGDYLKDTAHLSLLEHGVYTRLLDVYYTREIPFAEGEAERLVGARSKDEKAAVTRVLAEFFKDGRQDRCDAEIAKFQRKAEHNREVGKLGGRPPKTATQLEPRNNPSGFQKEPNPNPPNSQYPIAKKEKEKETPPNPRKRGKPTAWSAPEWVPAKEWADFETHRSAFRGVPFTDAARDGVVRELDKLRAMGSDPAQMLSTAITNGWRTVYPPRPAGMNGQHVNKQEALEASNRAVGDAWLKELQHAG